MKLKAVLFTAFLTLSTSAFAQFFPARAFVTVLPTQVSVEVYNPYYEPIICNGQVFGITASGHTFSSFFAEQYLPAGGYRYAIVRTNAFNVFVNGWPSIHCRYAHWF